MEANKGRPSDCTPKMPCQKAMFQEEEGGNEGRKEGAMHNHQCNHDEQSIKPAYSHCA